MQHKPFSCIFYYDTMQNSANFAPNSVNVEAKLTKANATGNNTETKLQLFTGNKSGEGSTNAFESCDYANRNKNNNSLSLEKKNSDGGGNADDDTDSDTDDIIEVRKIKYNNLDEKFVVHHVVREDCCNCCYSLVKKKNRKLKEKKKENLAYLSGVNSRCSCSGRRRSNLSGLIELFEQKLQLELSTSCSRDSSPEPLSARERLRSEFKKKIQKQQAVGDYSNKELEKDKQKQSDIKMRDIITPVKYQATTISNSSTDCDSTEFEFVQRLNTDERSNYDDQATDSRNKSLHHVAVKGVPVLPKPNVQKLTKTRWQPPTDGRQYEQRCSTPSSSYIPPHHSKSSSSSKKEVGINGDLEDSEYTSDSSHSSQEQQLRKSVSPDFRRAGIIGNSKRLVGGSTSASLAATRGPPIIKHQTTSSRRLLNQLARIRRLNEPCYRVKRPEKVAEVEKLIERLEKATADWEEDEHLLDRAELRDWPLEYHKRFSDQREREEEAGRIDQPTPIRLNEDTQEQDSFENFGCRLDVNPLEQDTITRSHYYNTMTGSHLNKQLQSNSANSTLTNRASRRSRAFADRYLDDLAVRRLSCGKFSSSLNTQSSSSSSSVVQINLNQPQMSYLLCSNAYTPSISTNIYSAYETLDQRAKNDDLHFRYVKNKPESHEPPFGIPRQLTNVASHSSASHYLRRQDLRRPATTTCASCACGNNYKSTTNSSNNRNDNEEFYQQTINSKRSDSKVSFNDTVDRAGGSTSVDSGVAASSPYSNGRQSSATSRLTPTTSPLILDSSNNLRLRAKSSHQETPIEQYVYEDDVTQEVDLDEMLAKEPYYQPSRLGFDLEYDQSICESPLLERHKAEIKATPIRRRPKINIENPRAKSPLLRIATKEIRPQSEKPAKLDNISNLSEQQLKVEIQCYNDKRERPSRKSTSELECKYDFHDEEDDEDNDEKDDEVVEGEKGENFIEKQASRIVNTNYETSDSSLVNETPSNIHLNYRGEESKTNVDTQSKQKQDKSGPSFSIGEYKPLNKPNLKIL